MPRVGGQLSFVLKLILHVEPYVCGEFKFLHRGLTFLTAQFEDFVLLSQSPVRAEQRSWFTLKHPQLQNTSLVDLNVFGFIM